jgi:hypothetical protein
MQSPKRKTTRDAIENLDRQIGKDPVALSLVEEALLSARVAQLIYDARNRAKINAGRISRLAAPSPIH